MNLTWLFFFIGLILGLNVSAQSTNTDWWKNAVIYQIYPRSFKDSDNNGVGDLQGIISKLDHFVDLGVTAIWMSPIFKSPGVDHGYDISDFRDIDPLFGTMDDFKQLMSEAKSKGLKVILDFVPNHSSDKHEWFGKSERREPGYENYYVWLDGKENNTKPPNNWVSYFHGPAWTFSETRQQWYLHQFAAGQPDLNYRDPLLVQEMKDILTFWMDLGVSGFRVDIISALFEVESYPDEPLSGDPNSTPDDYGYLIHIYTNDQPETYDMVYQWRALLDEYSNKQGGDQRIMMTESYSGDDKLFPYYGNATHNGAHFTFNFWFITRVYGSSTASNIKDAINQWFEKMPENCIANWVLGNHDQTRLATRFGTNRVDGLNMMALILPGVTVTYQGEEIGMENGEVTWEQGQDPQACNGKPEDFDKSSRDFERTPYHWDSTTNAGFNEGGETWLPVSKKYTECNLQQQKEQTKSHYKVYKAVLALKKTDIVKNGDYSVDVFPNNENVFYIIRNISETAKYIFISNINSSEETIDLTSKITGLPNELFVILSNSNSLKEEGTRVTTNAVTLTSYESLILSPVVD